MPVQISTLLADLFQSGGFSIDDWLSGSKSTMDVKARFQWLLKLEQKKEILEW